MFYKIFLQSIKKIGGAFERGIINMFEKKGLVTARAPEMGKISIFNIFGDPK
jgi:Holliday junction resolvase